MRLGPAVTSRLPAVCVAKCACVVHLFTHTCANGRTTSLIILYVQYTLAGCHLYARARALQITCVCLRTRCNAQMPPHKRAAWRLPRRIMGRIIDGAEEVDGALIHHARMHTHARSVCECTSGAITQVSVRVLCVRVRVRSSAFVRAHRFAFGSVCQKCVRLHEVSLVRCVGRRLQGLVP